MMCLMPVHVVSHATKNLPTDLRETQVINDINSNQDIYPIPLIFYARHKLNTMANTKLIELPRGSLELLNLAQVRDHISHLIQTNSSLMIPCVIYSDIPKSSLTHLMGNIATQDRLQTKRKLPRLDSGIAEEMMSYRTDTFNEPLSYCVTRKRQVSHLTDELLTFNMLKAFVLGGLLGTKSFQFGNQKPLTLDTLPYGTTEFINRLKNALQIIIQSIIDKLYVSKYIEESRENRLGTVLASQVGLLSIGVLIHERLNPSQISLFPMELNDICHEIEDLFEDVEWESKLSRWNKIAGKKNRSNRLSIGGVREYGHRTYIAISNPNTFLGMRIRDIEQQVIAQYTGPRDLYVVDINDVYNIVDRTEAIEIPGTVVMIHSNRLSTIIRNDQYHTILIVNELNDKEINILYEYSGSYLYRHLTRTWHYLKTVMELDIEDYELDHLEERDLIIFFEEATQFESQKKHRLSRYESEFTDYAKEQIRDKFEEIELEVSACIQKQLKNTPSNQVREKFHIKTQRTNKQKVEFNRSTLRIIDIKQINDIQLTFTFSVGGVGQMLTLSDIPINVLIQVIYQVSESNSITLLSYKTIDVYQGNHLIYSLVEEDVSS